MPRYGNEALQSLSDELDRTAVISPEFKSLILGWTIAATNIAYNEGRRDGKNAQVDHRDVPYMDSRGQSAGMYGGRDK